MGCTNRVRKKKFTEYRDIYNTKRDIIECKQSCKAIPNIQRKRKVQERVIYKAEIFNVGLKQLKGILKAATGL